MSLPLSVCLIVKDEADFLPRCLNSLQDLASEIVVVDTGSSDGTQGIARDMGAKVIQATWDDDFAKARNISLSEATQPWVLVIDADETLSAESRQALNDLWPELDPKTVYSFPLYVQGQGNWNYKQYLFANDPQLRYSGRVHEQIQTPDGYRKLVIDAIPIDHWAQKKGEERSEEKALYYATLLEKSLQDDPQDPHPHVYLAWYHLNRQRHDQALAHLKTAMPHLPTNSNFRLMAHLYQGLAHYHQHDWALALEQMDQGLALYPRYAEMHALRGMALLELGRFDEAEKALATAIYQSRQAITTGITAISALRPPAILEPLSRVFDAKKEPLPARLCRKLLNTPAPEMGQTLCQQLSELLRQKNWKGALWLITLFFPIETGDWAPAVIRQLNSPQRLERWLAEADVWSTMQAFGRWPTELKRLLQKAAREYPLDPRPWQRLADLAIQTRDWKMALEPLDRCLKIDPQSGWAWNARGIAALMLGDHEKAAASFRQTIQVGSLSEVEQAKQNLAQLQAAAK